MNNEIKEHMQNCIDREESCLLNVDNTKLLLNYITNLQQENESLRTRIKTIKRRRKHQTNKINKYKSIIFNDERALHDYKLRCEKAIEYINMHFEDDEGIICKIIDEHTCDANYNFLEDLIDILEGKNEYNK